MCNYAYKYENTSWEHEQKKNKMRSQWDIQLTSNTLLSDDEMYKSYEFTIFSSVSRWTLIELDTKTEYLKNCEYCLHIFFFLNFLRTNKLHSALICCDYILRNREEMNSKMKLILHVFSCKSYSIYMSYFKLLWNIGEELSDLI
jgi:hypothetical protein